MYICWGYNGNKITVVPALMDLTILKRVSSQRENHNDRSDVLHQRYGRAVPKRRNRCLNLTE